MGWVHSHILQSDPIKPYTNLEHQFYYLANSVFCCRASLYNLLNKYI